MKKLALLLGALSLVSSVAYAKEVVPAVEEVVVVEEVKPVAAPALTVTSIGQGLEIDNTSGTANGNIGHTLFSTSVGLAYGEDWTFGLMARKGWDVDTDDHIHSGSFRIDMDAWRDFGNYSLGARWRQESDNDKFYLRGKYEYGMLSGDMDVAYTSRNDSNNSDGWYFEGTPVAVKVGPVKVGYYVKSESDVAVSDDAIDGLDYWFRHQLRVSMPIYQGEKLNLGVQYGWEFANNVDYDSEAYSGAYKHDNNSHILWLNGSYKVTENLTIDGYYEYDMFKWELDGKESEKNMAGKQDNKDSNRYYGEFYLGWTYTF